MEISPDASVAETAEKANAIPWKSAAAAAASVALQVAGESGRAVVWRDGHPDGEQPWAAFDVAETGDVVWVAQVDGRAPAGTVAVATQFGELGVWRHPHDPELPGLARAVTPGGLGRLLAQVAPGTDPVRVDIVSVQPLQRAVVRVGTPENGVYVKVVPPWRAHVVAEHHRRARAGGLPTPEVLAVDEVWGLVVLAEVPGTPLATHLENGRPLPDPAEVRMLIERLEAVLGSHGDLHDRQLLVGEDGRLAGVVDLDEAGTCEALDDRARLIAHVAMRGVTHPGERHRIGPYAARLSAELSQRVDADALAALSVQVFERLEARAHLRSQ